MAAKRPSTADAAVCAFRIMTHGIGPRGLLFCAWASEALRLSIDRGGDAARLMTLKGITNVKPSEVGDQDVRRALRECQRHLSKATLRDEQVIEGFRGWVENGDDRASPAVVIAARRAFPSLYAEACRCAKAGKWLPRAESGLPPKKDRLRDVPEE